MNLYEMKTEYLQVLDALVSDESLTTQVIEDTLLPYKDEVEAKIENVALYIKNLEAEQEAINKVEQELSIRSDRIANKIACLQQYLMDNMVSLDMKKVKGKLLDVSVRENPYKVLINDENIIPKEYITIRTIEQHNIDKNKIKEDLLAGKTVDGAEVTRSKRIVISV